MFKKAVFLAVLIMALSFGSAFAYQIDSLSSSSSVLPPTQLFINPGGLGDVLLYGYYNVRNQDQFFTITNTSEVSGARVRIRFREAARIDAVCNGSQEVLDFDICLSKADMWTGRITTGSDGAAKLISMDTDTYVQTSGDASNAGNVTGTRVIFSDQWPNGQSFKYGEANTVEDITADNTREGYFEVIGERALDENCDPDQTVSTASDYCDCGYQRDVQDSDVGNELMGHTYMVNLGTMETYGYVATAMADFVLGDITSGIQSGAPDLTSCDDCILATPAITPVNYALTKSSLKGIYDLEDNFGGNTAWIVTFPTKWVTHDESECVNPDVAFWDSNDIFDDTTVSITIWDDQENPDKPTECEFSPCPGTPGNSLPEEVNVLNIEDSSIFTSDVARALDLTQDFDFGWINIDLISNADPVHRTIFGGRVSNGLPAIGYQAMKFAGGKATGMLPLQYDTLMGLAN